MFLVSSNVNYGVEVMGRLRVPLSLRLKEKTHSRIQSKMRDIGFLLVSSRPLNPASKNRTFKSHQRSFYAKLLSLFIQRCLEYLLKMQNIRLSTEVIQNAVRCSKYTMVLSENALGKFHTRNKIHESYLDFLKVVDISAMHQYEWLQFILYIYIPEKG